jgi:hypothetical protein
VIDGYRDKSGRGRQGDCGGSRNYRGNLCLQAFKCHFSHFCLGLWARPCQVAGDSLPWNVAPLIFRGSYICDLCLFRPDGWGCMDLRESARDEALSAVGRFRYFHLSKYNIWLRERVQLQYVGDNSACLFASFHPSGLGFRPPPCIL